MSGKSNNSDNSIEMLVNKIRALEEENKALKLENKALKSENNRLRVTAGNSLGKNKGLKLTPKLYEAAIGNMAVNIAENFTLITQEEARLILELVMIEGSTKLREAVYIMYNLGGKDLGNYYNQKKAFEEIVLRLQARKYDARKPDNIANLNISRAQYKSLSHYDFYTIDDIISDITNNNCRLLRRATANKPDRVIKAIADYKEGRDKWSILGIKTLYPGAKFDLTTEPRNRDKYGIK